MILRALWWLVKCVGFCLLGIVLCGWLTTYVTPPLWWVLHSENATYLSRPAFFLRYFFFIKCLYGLLLGLIPVKICWELIRSMFGLFRQTDPSQNKPELDWHRPILWAWTPVTIIFLFRFLAWQNPGSSVLSSGEGAGRFQHFFSPTSISMLYLYPSEAGNFVPFFSVITAPMLFLLSYTASVWIRHQAPPLLHAVDDASIDREQQTIEPH